MSDWIDRMKQNEEAQTEAQRKSNDIRLHKAQITKAKAPAFWLSLVDQLEQDSKKLRATFPNDTSRQVDFIKRGENYTLQSRKLPITIVELSLNLGGLCIDLEAAKKKDRYDQPILKPRDPIKLTVDDNDELVVAWKGHTFTDVVLLSEHLIKAVCGSEGWQSII